MGARAKITSKGQITLPKEVRDRHHLKPGDIVEFVERDGETIVKPRNIRAVDLAGILGPPPSGKGLSIEEIDEAIMDAVVEDDERIQREWHQEREASRDRR
ncbi:AbrB/MazE/SpoVT family DNA-binding domain-containing protein [Mesorhizobium sp. LHD-90]|uniref:AbrB/MazE/SpoVT family DNA-binding domain-containing protein n=1 Tax=Mesorhizobium sp. LHD-90 TaxID=3071414 RepID=UPI0027E07028|nr:AbrB/MazE/SpoVT family DNA-binding domain-containing protein [Mesorhizobium sp. LHD-90]MDQ6437004.1 AbrB/MazE/SpoVT family DNA-binding domain-containing protein [Mesorhizobium sp. LHD-90]